VLATHGETFRENIIRIVARERERESRVVLPKRILSLLNTYILICVCVHTCNPWSGVILLHKCVLEYLTYMNWSFVAL
jgi:hypothetical protein